VTNAAGTTWIAGPDRLPIVSHYAPALPAATQQRLARLARDIRDQECNLATVPPLDPRLDAGFLDGAPCLLVEDHSGILYAHERGSDITYTYRALVLGTDGDLLAVQGRRVPAFEQYCRETLGLGAVQVLVPAVPDPRRAPSLACAEDPSFVAAVASAAKRGGGLNLVPYMATGGAWRLAGCIARRAGVPVRVAGPPPNLTRQANDKTWFARCARQVLGPRAVPPCDAVYGLVGLVGHLRRRARASRSVALKLTHSAASGGNLVFNSSEITGLSTVDLRNRLLQAMHASGWREDYPIQVTVWEEPLVGSPSVQLWIPLARDGRPIVEGIFDQEVTGRIARFSGAVPSTLPSQWRERIALEALQLATLFQQLGYFGRCSFDSVIFGPDLARAELHWVECNGRWGGVSLPMTLANRLSGDWSRGGFVIASRRSPTSAVRGTAGFLDRYADHLYRPESGEGGAILLCPGRLESGSGVDLLFLAASHEEARERCDALLARVTAPANSDPA
jgi:hypothetical protein